MKSITPPCRQALRLFERETYLRAQSKQAGDKMIAFGASIAAFELQRARFDHISGCSQCLKAERAELGRAA